MGETVFVHIENALYVFLQRRVVCAVGYEAKRIFGKMFMLQVLVCPVLEVLNFFYVLQVFFDQLPIPVRVVIQC